MADITLQPSRPAASALATLDAALETLEGFLHSFIGDRPSDLRHALHEAQIRHLAACGNRGQAIL